jgi:hypothetical protein
MIIFNLTDRLPGSSPIPVKVAGLCIQPGESGLVPEGRVRRAKLAGLEQAGLISIGALPEWSKTSVKAETFKPKKRRRVEDDHSTRRD